MEAMQVTTQAPCGSPLAQLEIPMINTMVACLGSEHRKLNDLNLQLALAATRLAHSEGEAGAYQRAVALWDEIQRDLWSHLQIEDELVLSWGEQHHAISRTLLDTLKTERQETRELIAALPSLFPEIDPDPQRAAERLGFARTLLALTQRIDRHVERYDGEVLPSILRSLFHSSKVRIS
jgi:hemerythrin-like domain-containing protein